jgi:hypothetical protein
MTLTHNGGSELSQLIEGTNAGALIPEIVRRGFQELLEAEVSALTGAHLHERCPDQRSTHRNGYRRRLLTTHRILYPLVAGPGKQALPKIWIHRCISFPKVFIPLTVRSRPNE